jgi:hypothetical protein
MRALRPALCLAQTLGAMLGAGALLLRALPPRTASPSAHARIVTPPREVTGRPEPSAPPSRHAAQPARTGGPPIRSGSAASRLESGADPDATTSGLSGQPVTRLVQDRGTPPKARVGVAATRSGAPVPSPGHEPRTFPPPGGIWSISRAIAAGPRRPLASSTSPKMQAQGSTRPCRCRVMALPKPIWQITAPLRNKCTDRLPKQPCICKDRETSRHDKLQSSHRYPVPGDRGTDAASRGSFVGPG